MRFFHPRRAARQVAVPTRKAEPAALDRPVSGSLMLRPGGDHWVRIDVNGVCLLVHLGQLDRLEKLFDAARAEVEADGYRTNDRTHMHAVRLGSF